ncbi:degT/DnrJ/EryC1/StrS aminotransferase [Kitasatospora sp. NPDC096077]|uniref:degT/DnrJ/EryC1/StrS aminotransferase n=1 Tax=unclassified Kitasatospora TaxID=2633591 RepID=UPI00331EC912
MELFDTAVVLTRVMTSGTVMSIEKSDRELPGLERLLAKATGRAKVVLVNSRTAAVHAALAGQGIGHGDTADLPGLDPRTAAFVSWLGVTVRAEEGARPAFDQISLDQQNADRLRELARPVGVEPAPVLVVDLTGLGFGPAAAVLTDDPKVWARAERLKIFGAYDLRTMWTQEEADADLVPGVQFNYRLSPLVAACVRMAVQQASSSAPSGASA